MGTTVVSAVASGSDLHIAWVGDSRAYLLRAGKAFPLTRDHAKVQQLVDAGQLSPEQAKVHPERNVITRSVGRRSEVLVDTFQVEFAPGDVLLLCTDGLTDVLGEQDISRVISKANSPQNACDRLIELCERLGASDNVTTIIASL
jgi:protein phosphatase